MTQSALIGSTGRVGAMVARAWSQSTHPWHTAPVQTRRMDQPATDRHIPWDITAQGAAGLARWMDQFGPLQALVVLAGTTPATGQDMGDNVTLARHYVQAAQTLGIPRVLVASSSAIYGPGHGRPISETDPCAPINAYGQSKLDMEADLQTLTGMGTEICCLRIGNVLGADALLLNAAKGGAVQIDQFADGHGPMRSYVAPGVLGHILGHLAVQDAPLPFVLNVAQPSPVYMEDLAKAAGLDWDTRPAPENALQNLTLSCERLCALLPDIPAHCAVDMIDDWKRHRVP